MNNEASSILGRLEIEYKRVTQMSTLKKGRAYFKGYIAALIFAINLIKADKEEQV